MGDLARQTSSSCDLNTTVIRIWRKYIIVKLKVHNQIFCHLNNLKDECPLHIFKEGMKNPPCRLFQ